MPALKVAVSFAIEAGAISNQTFEIASAFLKAQVAFEEKRFGSTSLGN
jgi:hypothetical protein